MKWATLISIVIVLSCTESRILNKRHHHEGHVDNPPHLIGDLIPMIGVDNSKGLVLAAVSQMLPLCPYEEHLQRVEDVMQIADLCAKGARHANCAKSPMTIILDELCKKPENAEKYPFHQECCKKEDPERHKCFVEHKMANHEELTKYVRPAPEQICKDHAENRGPLLARYIFMLAIGHPHMYIPAILGFAQRFDGIVSHCCKDVETAGQCFNDKMPEHKQEVEYVCALQKHNCYILQDFKERALTAYKAVQASQKFPLASFENVQIIVPDTVHLHQTCCGGDMMACMLERMKLTAKICEKKDELATHLKECCDKPLLERSACIIRLPNDQKPADLSPKVPHYIDDPEVCKLYTEGGDTFMGRFLYECARRHQDYSPEMLLRMGSGYEEFLKKCCAAEGHNECLAKTEESLKKEIESSVTLLKTNCGALDKLKSYLFQNLLIFKYVARMPALSEQSLLRITKSMTTIGEKCCHRPEDQQMTCSEGGLGIVFGQICMKQKTTPVNEKVAQCCSHSLSSQTPCFSALPVDETYVPPPLSVASFNFNDELCTTSEPEQQSKKQVFLIRLMKQYPHMTDEQLKTCVVNFVPMVDQCCKADNHNECFALEGAKLIDACKAILAVHPAVEVSV
uniref:Serum albumin n=1 Tax=Ambystoma maculatum TaxID=43114 RepID=Q8UW05_AMBMC|nr:serum albumin precursor [Ambystoma maculatum]